MSKFINSLLKLICFCIPISFSAFSYDFWMPVGKPIKWAKDTLEFKVDPVLGEEGRKAFIDSATKWSAALDGKIKFVEAANKSGDQIDIYLYPEKFTPEIQGETNFAGFTDIGLDSDGSIITFARIRLNSDCNFSRTESQGYFSYDDIIMHELGHCLGLWHPEMNKVKYPYNPLKNDMPTMYHKIQKFGMQSDLHLDDISGIKALYGQLEPLIPQVEPLDIIAQKIKYRRYAVYLSEPYSYEEMTTKVDGIEYKGKVDWYRLKRGLHKIEAELNQGYWIEGKPIKRTGILYLQVGKPKRIRNNCFKL